LIIEGIAEQLKAKRQKSKVYRQLHSERATFAKASAEFNLVIAPAPNNGHLMRGKQDL